MKKIAVAFLALSLFLVFSSSACLAEENRRVLVSHTVLYTKGSAADLKSAKIAILESVSKDIEYYKSLGFDVVVEHQVYSDAIVMTILQVGGLEKQLQKLKP